MSCIRKGNESGQVLLITLLVLAVATTIGLGAIGRSSTDVSISNRMEESAAAFSAAEAGIERGLLEGTDIATTSLSTGAAGVKYTVDVTTQGGASVYQFPQKTPKGSVETLWLSPYDPATNTFGSPAFSGASVNLCWSSETTVPAMVVSILYLQGAEYRIRRVAYDPSNRSNSFTLVGGTVSACGQSGVYRQAIAISAPGTTPLAMRIEPVYSGAQLYVDPGAFALPLQGTRIESSGTTDTGITRKIVAFQEYRSPSAIFDSVIYTSGPFIR